MSYTVTPKTSSPRKTKTVSEHTTFRDHMERAAQAVRTYFEQEAPKGRFLVGTHNANRLNRALRVGQLSHLINRTLLSRAIHQHHTHRLFDRLVRLCGKKRNTDIQFLTVLHKLAVLDAPTCLKEVRRFRTLLDDIFGQCQGSHIIDRHTRVSCARQAWRRG